MLGIELAYKRCQRSINISDLRFLHGVSDALVLNQISYWAGVRQRRFNEKQLGDPPELMGNTNVYFFYKSILEWSRETGLSPSTIKRVVSRLKQLPFIYLRRKKAKHGGFVNEFGINLPEYASWSLANVCNSPFVGKSDLIEANLNLKDASTQENIIMGMTRIERQHEIVTFSLPWCELLDIAIGHHDPARWSTMTQPEGLIPYIITKTTLKELLVTMKTEENNLTFEWLWLFYRRLFKGRSSYGNKGGFRLNGLATDCLKAWSEVIDNDDLDDLLPLLITEYLIKHIENKPANSPFRYQPHLQTWLRSYNTGSFDLPSNLDTLSDLLSSASIPANDRSMEIERLL